MCCSACGPARVPIAVRVATIAVAVACSNGCGEKAVKLAYHTLCAACATVRTRCCALRTASGCVGADGALVTHVFAGSERVCEVCFAYGGVADEGGGGEGVC